MSEYRRLVQDMGINLLISLLHKGYNNMYIGEGSFVVVLNPLSRIIIETVVRLNPNLKDK